MGKKSKFSQAMAKKVTDLCQHRQLDGIVNTWGKSPFNLNI